MVKLLFLVNIAIWCLAAGCGDVVALNGNRSRLALLFGALMKAVIDRIVVKKRRRKVEERYEHHAFKQSRLLRKMAQFNLGHQNLGSLPPLIWSYRYEQSLSLSPSL